MKHHFPDSSFLVSLGDQINDYNDNEQYNAFLNHGALYSTSLAPVKGNHDMGGPQFTEHYALPNQSELGTCDGADGNYWFTRGNALFLVLNTMDPAKWGEHKDFIASAVEANPDCKWKIVFSHFSPYNAYEDYLTNAENIRPYFLEFTDAYDIDLVMCGHDHLYTRTHFIQADGSFTEYESPAVSPEGTLYLTLNSSSGSLYKRPSPMHEAAVSEKRENPEITDVQVTPESLTITTYAAETWEILDTFEIQK
jgi:predicted phosphodiesterase